MKYEKGLFLSSPLAIIAALSTLQGCFSASPNAAQSKDGEAAPVTQNSINTSPTAPLKRLGSDSILPLATFAIGTGFSYLEQQHKENCIEPSDQKSFYQVTLIDSEVSSTIEKSAFPTLLLNEFSTLGDHTVAFQLSNLNHLNQNKVGDGKQFIFDYFYQVGKRALLEYSLSREASDLLEHERYEKFLEKCGSHFLSTQNMGFRANVTIDISSKESFHIKGDQLETIENEIDLVPGQNLHLILLWQKEKNPKYSTLSKFIRVNFPNEAMKSSTNFVPITYDILSYADTRNELPESKRKFLKNVGIIFERFHLKEQNLYDQIQNLSQINKPDTADRKRYNKLIKRVTELEAMKKSCLENLKDCVLRDISLSFPE